MAMPMIRLRVTADAERQLRGGHPWLYAGSIREQNRPGAAGELAVVYDRQNRFLVLGFFDPDSPLRLRVLARGKPQILDDAWWHRHLANALAKRQALASPTTTGLRLIHGENDDWPGLVLDRYDETLVLKLYTSAWLPHLPRVTGLLEEHLRPARLVLRLSRNIQEAAAGFGIANASLLLGPPVSEPVVFLENGIRFEAEVLQGQKTGFFLDQRENRQLVEALAEGRDVLNAFSFSGGFSLYAARGGARSVTDLDISPHALRGAERNRVLNAADPRIRQCPHRTIQADVFRWMNEPTRDGFDLIILDPPSLARRESERSGAIAAYGQLASQAARRLRPGGILAAASCSAHVSRDEFFAAVRSGVAQSQSSHEILRSTEHPIDHQPAFPEASYLKCLYLRVPKRSPGGR